MQEGQNLDVTIDKFANRGKSLTRVDGFVVFVRSAVPGDRMRIRITSKKKNYAEAEPIDLIEPSRLRTAPRCIYADTCGGCQWQHVSYGAQLEMKEQTVTEALTYTGNIDLESVNVHPIVPADLQFYYRNKMAFAFSGARTAPGRSHAPPGRRNQTFSLGLHPRGESNAVLDLHECYLQSPLSIRLVNELRGFFLRQNWSAWNPETSDGYLRRLVLRMAARTNNVMAYLTTTGHDETRLSKLTKFVRETFPDVTTLVHAVQRPAASTTSRTDTLFGEGILREDLGGYRFEVGPRTFFQPNTRQAERLYETVTRLEEFTAADRVYDLYCGIGTLSLFLSDRVRNVVGIEVEPAATRLADRNAHNNDVANCRFMTGRVKEQLPKAVRESGTPDVIICDPPRAGLDQSVVRQIMQTRPDRLVYVSCDPQTQARDVKRLKDTYRLTDVQPVDLFPQTYHVENVARLSRRS